LGVTIVSDVTTASSGSTKDFAFNIQNLTTSVSLSGTPMDTDTKEITADTAYDLTIDQNTDVLAGAVLELQVTKTGAPTDLTNAEIIGVVKYKDNSYS